MTVYWSHRSFPEMTGAPRDTQDRAWAALRLKPFRDWRMWLALACPALLLPAMVWAMRQVPTDRHYHVTFYTAALLIFGLPGALWGLLLHLLHLHLARQYLLTRRGHCPAGGNDLRTLPDRCPECGAVPANRNVAP